MYLHKPKIFDVFKTLFLSDIVDNDDGMCAFIIGAGDSPKSLLPSGIPYLQFDDVSADCDGPI